MPDLHTAARYEHTKWLSHSASFHYWQYYDITVQILIKTRVLASLSPSGKTDPSSCTTFTYPKLFDLDYAFLFRSF